MRERRSKELKILFPISEFYLFFVFIISVLLFFSQLFLVLLFLLSLLSLHSYHHHPSLYLLFLLSCDLEILGLCFFLLISRFFWVGFFLPFVLGSVSRVLSVILGEWDFLVVVFELGFL